jgi:transcriptional regulator with XRE-family HTH domain
MQTASPGGGVPTWTLSDRLRKIRRDRHLTQEQMARSLDVQPATWAAWESGRTRPQDVIELAGQIEKRFGVPAAWTLGVLSSPRTETGEIAATQRNGLPPVPKPRERGGKHSENYGRRWNDVMFTAAAL